MQITILYTEFFGHETYVGIILDIFDPLIKIYKNLFALAICMNFPWTV